MQQLTRLRVFRSRIIQELVSVLVTQDLDELRARIPKVGVVYEVCFAT
jgi:hypothetical protein